MLDVRIVGGWVLDGTGTPAARADVGLRNGRIEAIGDLSRAEADATVEAAGLYVCPGFIDVHSHSDVSLLVHPAGTSKITQGVTTEILGNCGMSAAPLTGKMAAPSDWKDLLDAGRWESVAEYRTRMEQTKPSVNVGLLIGHGNLRKAVIGYDHRPATSSELERMKDLLKRSLDEGGRGFSTGLMYVPGRFASRGELVELARVAANHGGVYATHMRNEGAHLLEAIEEALAIGQEAGIRVEISHLKTTGSANWHLLDVALARIQDARGHGQEVAADCYPYLRSYTDLDIILPDWVTAGDHAAVLTRLRDARLRERLRKELLALRSAEFWAGITIASTRHPDNHRFQGMPLLQASTILGQDPIETALRLMEADELATTAFFAGMSEPNLLRILKMPWVMIGSDASARPPTGTLTPEYPHPRAYGTFCRFLRLALDGKTVSLPEAVRKMTTLPAEQFGLRHRGHLAPSCAADVVVFDPRRVRDHADYDRVHELSEGIEHVWVNGVWTLREGKITGQRGGVWLL